MNFYFCKLDVNVFKNPSKTDTVVCPMGCQIRQSTVAYTSKDPRKSMLIA